MVIDLLARRLQAVVAVVLDQVFGIGHRADRHRLVLALSKRLDGFEALGKHKGDDQILLLEPAEILVEGDEALLHIALVVHQVGVEFLHRLGLTDAEVQLADGQESIGTALEVHLRPEHLIEDDDIVVTNLVLTLEHLDLGTRQAVLPHRDAMFEEAERLQQAVAGGVGQGQAALVDVGAHLHIVAREQVVQQILVLDGNGLLEDELIERLDQKLVAMQIDKYNSHK